MLDRTAPSSPTRRLGVLAVAALALIHAPVSGQDPEPDSAAAVLVGRVLDLDENLPITDAVVRLEDTDLTGLTDAEGLFRFQGVSAARHVLQVEHVAYGLQKDTVRVRRGETVAVRIALGREAIHLDAVVVTARSPAQQRRRARGTRRNEIDRPRLRTAADGTVSLGALIGEEVPGAWVKNRPSRPGEDICVEFRRPSSLRDPRACHYPMIVMDGIRVMDPGGVLTGIELEEIERVDVLSPAEAGLLYGTGSAWGVVVIETRRGRSPAEDQMPASHAFDESSFYPWELETDDHPWGRSFLGGVLGNAVGLTAGMLLADRCLELTDRDNDSFGVRCGTWATVGSQLAVTGLPILGTALGAGLGGRTSSSHGDLAPAALASGLALLPGYVVATSGTGTSSLVEWLGAGIVVLGMPAAAALADHLFRTFDPDD